MECRGNPVSSSFTISPLHGYVDLQLLKLFGAVYTARPLGLQTTATGEGALRQPKAMTAIRLFEVPGNHCKVLGRPSARYVFIYFGVLAALSVSPSPTQAQNYDIISTYTSSCMPACRGNQLIMSSCSPQAWHAPVVTPAALLLSPVYTGHT